MDRNDHLAWEAIRLNGARGKLSDLQSLFQSGFRLGRTLPATIVAPLLIKHAGDASRAVSILSADTFDRDSADRWRSFAVAIRQSHSYRAVFRSFLDWRTPHGDWLPVVRKA